MAGLRLLCCLNRSSCNIILVLVRIWSEQKKENDRYKDQSYDRSDSERACTCNNQADLIYTKCNNISKNVLEENCKPEPFSGLHLMCHCGNSCKARRVKQVEQQERKCCYCCREPCFDSCTNDHGIFCIITSYVCKNTHCTDDGLFCGESGDGCCNRLPFAKSKRSKDRSKDTAKDSHDTVVAVLNKSDSASCISDTGKDPHDNCCKEKNCTGFDDEFL